MVVNPWDSLGQVELLRPEEKVSLPGLPLLGLFEQAVVEMSNKACILECGAHTLGIDPPAMLAQLVDRFELHAFDKHFAAQHFIVPAQSHVIDLEMGLT